MNIDFIIALLLALILLMLMYLAYRLNSAEFFLQNNHKKLETFVRQQTDDLFSQLEIDRILRDKLKLNKDLPYTKDWAASPDFLKIIVEHCLDNKPAVVFECSSGLTTLMLARCCQLSGQGHVYSLEKHQDYAANTRSQLQQYELTGVATVIDAALTAQKVADETYQWYDSTVVPEVTIDMLVIDGPPGFIQKHSRYPALPILFDHLSEHCVIFLDDAARDDEKEIIERWLAAYPKSQHQYVNTQRGCSIFYLKK